jgi:hypothetical protein
VRCFLCFSLSHPLWFRTATKSLKALFVQLVAIWLSVTIETFTDVANTTNKTTNEGQLCLRIIVTFNNNIIRTGKKKEQLPVTNASHKKIKQTITAEQKTRSGLNW